MTGIAKNDAVHFFTCTSKFNWTLDFFGLQYANDKFIDMKAETFSGKPTWEEDWDQNNQGVINNDNVVKAHLNPSSPFIALPNNLFRVVREEWLDSLDSTEASCSADKCLVFKPCSQVYGLRDFGIKLGSRNDTTDEGETLDEEETENILHRGPRETIYNEWREMYFRIPFESYLISGEKLNSNRNTCFLAITGFIPDEERTVILG